MSVMNLTTNSYLVDQSVTAVAYEDYYNGVFMAPALAGIQASVKSEEKIGTMKGLGIWSTKTPGQQPTPDILANEYTRIINHSVYAKQVQIWRELIDDQEYAVLQQIASALGDTGRITFEVLAAQMFHNSFTSALSPDGQAVCSSGHVNADGTNTQSNLTTNSLTFANVVTGRAAMRGFKGANGLLLGMNGRALVVPPALEEHAWSISKSANVPRQAELNDNMFAVTGGMSLFVWDWLGASTSGGSDTRWWLVDPVALKKQLLIFIRTALEIFGTGNLLEGTRILAGYIRMSLAWTGWTAVYGSNAT